MSLSSGQVLVALLQELICKCVGNLMADQNYSIISFSFSIKVDGFQNSFLFIEPKISEGFTTYVPVYP